MRGAAQGPPSNQNASRGKGATGISYLSSTVPDATRSSDERGSKGVGGWEGRNQVTDNQSAEKPFIPEY